MHSEWPSTFKSSSYPELLFLYEPHENFLKFLKLWSLCCGMSRVCHAFIKIVEVGDLSFLGNWIPPPSKFLIHSHQAAIVPPPTCPKDRCLCFTFIPFTHHWHEIVGCNRLTEDLETTKGSQGIAQNRSTLFMENSSLTTFPSLKLVFFPNFFLYHSCYSTHQEILLALLSKCTKNERF